MSYRASTAAILDVAAPAVRVLGGLGRSYRLAVDTLPSPDPDSTFAGRPMSYLQRVTTEVSTQLSSDPRFLGFAVHDLRGWLDLRPSDPTPPR